MGLAPEVQYVTRGSAGRMEALVDVLAQVHREGTPSSSLRTVDGTRTSTLGTSAPQAVEVPQVTQDTFQRDLAAKVGVVDRIATGSVGCRGRELCRRFGVVDGLRCGIYGSAA